MSLISVSINHQHSHSNKLTPIASLSQFHSQSLQHLNHNALHSWVSEHTLASIGALWATGIGASFLANSSKTSAMKPSLRLIHARMHAQALTLAVLSGAAAFHYYENHRLSSDAQSPNPQQETAPSDFRNFVEWEVFSPL